MTETKLCIMVMCTLLSIASKAQITSNQRPTSKDSFELVGDNGCAPICYDKHDATVVATAANLLAEDIKNVTGKRPKTANGISSQNGNAVLIGTIGYSQLIDRLIEEKKIDADKIIGDWERFIIQTVDDPLPNVKKALVIAGSDRRGTAYGVFTLSESMGVSPWYWWADVPIEKKCTLYIDAEDYVSTAPTIKYRGIFINDEDWGIHPWAAKNFEKELNDIGPKTYARICELILRLKGNMLAPAMHTCSRAFYTIAENKVVADRYAIAITTAHCEPLLFNNASLLEWDSKVDGEWNYSTNKERIRSKLDKRVAEAHRYENIYTVGMRGLHDEGMRGNLSDTEKVGVLTQAINDQRGILNNHIDKPLEQIPQIFIPYKEALDVYELGLQVPDDITLIWVDDNYGYIKRLSDEHEMKRKGGSGVYYHLSYLGAPHDYLWLCTTPPMLMYEELKKAYDTGADRYWLLNVGDIKPMELGMQTFFDMAWQLDKYGYDNINEHQSSFLSDIFGSRYGRRFQNILDEYYRLAWSRKPELMGWEREWDAPERGALTDTEYSFDNYNDAQKRLHDYRTLSNECEKLMNEMPDNMQIAFFEILGYPAMASCQMNRKHLMAQLAREKSAANRLDEANWAAEQSQAAFDDIESLNRRYNALLNGKWNHMMQLAPGWVAKYQNMPELQRYDDITPKPVDLTPAKERNELNRCTVIDLRKYKNKIAKNGQTLRILDGIGYDWHSLQLGEATEKSVELGDSDNSVFEYEFTGVDSDSVTVYVYTIPFFPLHKNTDNRFGIAVDDRPPFVANNSAKEFSETWKDNVLRNGAVAKVTFPVDRSLMKHTLTFTCIDPGTVIQRVVVDWGGLRDTYVGPSIR